MIFRINTYDTLRNGESALVVLFHSVFVERERFPDLISKNVGCQNLNTIGNKIKMKSKRNVDEFITIISNGNAQ